MQEKLVIANKLAWETKAYQAWVQKYGTPEEIADKAPSTAVAVERAALKNAVGLKGLF